MAVLWVKRQCDLWPRRDKDHCGNCLHPFVLESSQTEQTGLASSTPRCRVGVERLNAEILKSDLFSRGSICGPLRLRTPPLPTVMSRIVAPLEQPSLEPVERIPDMAKGPLQCDEAAVEKRYNLSTLPTRGAHCASVNPEDRCQLAV